MRPMQRTISLLASVLLVLCACLSAGGAQAQGVDPTQLFQNLTPEQQDALLQQLGGAGLSSLLGGGTGSLTERITGRPASGLAGMSGQLTAQQQLQLQLLQEEQLAAASAQATHPTNAEGIPILVGGDWVIVEVGFVLPRQPTPQGVPGALTAGQMQPSAQSIQQALASGAPAQTAASSAVAAQLATNGGLGQAGQLAALGALPGLGAPALAGTGQPVEQTTAGAPGSTVSPYESYPAAVQPMTPEDLQRLNALITLIRSRNPYQLSPDGVLTLPGFRGIPLAGLTAQQAALRLQVVPDFEHLQVRVTYLPLRKTGAEALKPFGYDLFQHAPSTFAPVTDVPVPADYIIGPGDELQVQLYGSQNRAFYLIVGRDGVVNFPALGPITVGGQRFGAAKALIESRVEHEMIGTRAAIAMGDTRAIRVFVLGEARRPGSYVVSGLATITSALYAAGGVLPVGSLRNIELKRNGTLVRQLDLYDLLIRGDTTDDAKLLPGDVIFIPPIGKTVSVAGEVHRPAIYEIKNETSPNDVIALAGGLTPKADPANAMISRIDEHEQHIVLPADLGATQGGPGLRNGDLLRVPTLRPTLDDGVVLIGHVFTPGDYAYTPGMRLTDVIHSVEDVQPDADLHYILIRREVPPDLHITALSADLALALANPNSSANIQLMPRDRIFVFDQQPGRERIIKPIIDELKLAGTAEHPTRIVRVDGRVKAPGDYPLEAGMTIADLIRAGGGLSVAAYGGKAELSRYEVVNGQTRRMRIIDVDLFAALRGDPSQNVKLQPYDNLSVKELSQWNEQESITLIGEVRFPGRYVFKNGETLRSVIARAGGLTEYAFPEGAVFTREGLRRREQEEIDLLAQRMQTDLTTMVLQGAAAGLGGANASALSVGQSLLTQIRGARAVGRLVIDLPRLIRERPGSNDDVVLRDGDQLIVPRFQQQVTVIGEVQSVTSHLYNPALHLQDYIARSGGLTRRADKSRIYVVRANGSVVAHTSNRWFEGPIEIKPGDTIVVPLNLEKLPALPFWQAVTSILYNVSIAVAAVHSF